MAQNQEHLERSLIQHTLPAVVQIVALRQGFMGNLSAAWTGSGTIVDSRGLILTNCHVANPRAMGVPAPPADRLGIAITERSDQPPVLTYFAEVVVQSPEMDLAVIRIVEQVDGKAVNNLKLSAIPVGDSDQLEIGDMLSIFGYPGIGGETVTFTSGSVSGFSQQTDLIKGRAWIKTDATIAGGNSGGTAVDAAGRLVGIPTQAAAGTGVRPVDARPVVDTNQDGVVDERDTPMAIGGFINGLRPVNMAKPLLTKAGVNVAARPSTPAATKPSTPAPAPAKPSAPAPAPVKPSAPSAPADEGSDLLKRYRSGGAIPPAERGGAAEERPTLGGLKSIRKGQAPAQPSNEPSFTNLVFSDQVTQDGRPINPSAILSGGRTELYASFDYNNMQNGLTWGQVWTVNGQKVYEDESPWQDGPSGRKTLAVASQTPIPDGEIQLALTVKRQILAQGQVTIGRRAADADTEISGQVIDRESKAGLADALVIALKPGVRTADFLSKQSKELAFTSARTDRNGRFTFPQQLPKGQAYSLVVVARGYRDMTIESGLRISATSPEKATIFPVPMIKG